MNIGILNFGICLQNSYFPESQFPHLIDSDSIYNVENTPPLKHIPLYIN